MKNPLRLLFTRTMIYGSAIIIKLLILFAVIMSLQTKHVWFYQVSILISAAVVLYIINDNSNPAYKIAWIVPIMMFPLYGGIFYVLFGKYRPKRKFKKKLGELRGMMDRVIGKNADVLEEIEEDCIAGGNQSRYITNYAKFPPFKNTKTEYYPIGEDMYESLKQQLEKAEKYIFMEFFIVEEGVMWDGIFEILKRKVREGVDVRFMWDDFGSILRLPKDFKKKVESFGIKCEIFNPLRPMFTLRLNNRNHRKIVVIDGHTGFVGGINIADEYINKVQKLGHWKDTAVMLKGEAVWSLTVMFLSMWNMQSKTEEDYKKYRPETQKDRKAENDGYVQPYTDNPLDSESVGENVYLNLINKAEKYVYITTPYLIIDNEMVTALKNAAKSGVDVRIITPFIPDKWYVHAVTRAYYNILMESGVKIYEYTPGFIHAKSFVVDDRYAVVGTINMDYRSLYLHFECAVWMYKCSCIKDIKEDFIRTMGASTAVSFDEIRKIKWWQKLGRAFLRAFAPHM